MATFVRYVLFAVLSGLANLGTQEAIVRVAPVAAMALSIPAGTVAGFGAKYVLDKNWIFYDAYSNHGQELRKLTIYGLFSVVTTLVFWGFEVACWAVWQTSAAKYAGGVVGLSIGYAFKYLLDRNFVFGGATHERA
jgi:putative flippase GtrA